MPFRNLRSDAYTPDILNVLYEAFDLAWTEISAEYGNDPTRIEFARRGLALAILSAYQGGARGSYALKEAALSAFAAMRPKA
jgi:hypothetical protein